MIGEGAGGSSAYCAVAVGARIGRRTKPFRENLVEA